MDVNYGKEVKRYLSEHVTLLRIHRFDVADVQFDDALVSSVVVWFRKSPPREQSTVRFTSGSSLSSPTSSRPILLSDLKHDSKWSRLSIKSSKREDSSLGPKLSDLFQIKRGLATGANKFFILTPDDVASHRIPSEFLVPILPSPRYLTSNEIEAEKNGDPRLDKRLYLLDCKLQEPRIRSSYPSLWAYLESGKKQQIHMRYICAHRSPWYSQEKRPPAPLLCTYMGRSDTKSSRTFRFILNHSQALVANVYLMLYPRPSLLRVIAQSPHILRLLWDTLNAMPIESLIETGRSYGGGLHKLEPSELAQAPAGELVKLLASTVFHTQSQADLFTAPSDRTGI